MTAVNDGMNLQPSCSWLRDLHPRPRASGLQSREPRDCPDVSTRGNLPQPATRGTALMNKPTKPSTIAPVGISPEEWQARIDLAAAYRLIAHYGWDDVIYNHTSMRVPGEDRNFLIKRHELLYTEVTASNLVKVCMDDDLDESAGVNRPGF